MICKVHKEENNATVVLSCSRIADFCSAGMDDYSPGQNIGGNHVVFCGSNTAAVHGLSALRDYRA
jgi:hypothetical protein